MTKIPNPAEARAVSKRVQQRVSHSEHARQRQEERAISSAEIAQVVARPETTYPDRHHHDRRHYVADGIEVVLALIVGVVVTAWRVDEIRVVGFAR